MAAVRRGTKGFAKRRLSALSVGMEACQRDAAEYLQCNCTGKLPWFHHVQSTRGTMNAWQLGMTGHEHIEPPCGILCFQVEGEILHYSAGVGAFVNVGAAIDGVTPSLPFSVS